MFPLSSVLFCLSRDLSIWSGTLHLQKLNHKRKNSSQLKLVSMWRNKIECLHQVINKLLCEENITILCLWFRTSLIYINNCPTRCNTKQSIYYSASSLYMWIKNPTDATVCRYLFTAKLLYMFRVSQHPSSGVSKTVPAASGTGHTTCTANPLLRGLVWTSLYESTRVQLLPSNVAKLGHVGGK